MKRTKKSIKPTKRAKVRESKPQNPQHRRAFDQLLNDAIFGVKKTPTRRD